VARVYRICHCGGILEIHSSIFGPTALLYDHILPVHHRLTTNKYVKQGPSENLTVAQLFVISQSFVGPMGSLPFTQQLATEYSLQAVISSLKSAIMFLTDPF